MGEESEIVGCTLLLCLGFHLLKREKDKRRREREKTGREGFKKIKVRKLP